MGNCCLGEVHEKDELGLISDGDEYELKRIGGEIIP